MPFLSSNHSKGEAVSRAAIEAVDVRIPPDPIKVFVSWAVFWLVLVGLIVWGVWSCSTDRPAAAATIHRPSGPAGLVPVAGHVSPGVDVYTRDGALVGTIQSVDAKARMIWFKYADGRWEQKKWDAVIRFPWYVREQ